MTSPPEGLDARTQIARYVENAYSVLDSANYYQILGVPKDARDDRIRAGYYKLAAILHPDLHGEHFDAELQRKLTSVFSRVVEAYRILSNAPRRKEYDAQLAGGKLRYDIDAASHTRRHQPEDDLSPNGKKFFKLGRAALAASDGKGAVMHLRLALSVDPDSALIRGELAKAEALAKSQGSG